MRLFALGWIVAGVLGVAGSSLAARPNRPARALPSRTSKPTSAAPTGHNETIRAWSRPTPGARAPRDEKGRPMLALKSLYREERVVLRAQTDRGGFSPADRAAATRFFREPGSNRELPIHPGTLDALYRIQRHFDAEELRVLSATRIPTATKREGNHGRGRAVDFVVPGTTVQEVGRFARELGFVGVGVYPISGFVHVDVRPKSYFWVDRSGPGRKNRERGILLDIAEASDRAARARGETPPFFGPDGGAPTDEDEDD
jgi:uncharacterized protein YcbK (DUF882 family)